MAGIDALEALRNVGSGQDLIKSRLLQEQRAKDMRRNLDLERETQNQDIQHRFLPKSQSELGRDRAMGWDLGGVRSFSGATPGDYGELQRTLSESPEFGTQAQEVSQDNTEQMRQANLQGFATPQEGAAYTQHAAAMKTQMPLLVEQEKNRGAQDLLRQQNEHSDNAFGQLLQGGGMNGLNGGRGPQQVNMAINAKGEPSFSAILEKQQPYTAQEHAMMDANNAIGTLGGKVLDTLRALHPDIEQNPDKYSSLFDAVPNALGGRLFYRHGAQVPAVLNGSNMDSNLRQDIGAIQAAAAKAQLSGRLSAPMLEFIQQHLPDADYSHGENYRRIKNLIQNIGPALVGGIEQSRGMGGGAQHDPYADPNWGAPQGGR